MPGTSAKTAEVKLRVPIEIASAIETYAQAHTHGNKTKAYLHFLEAGLTAQSDQAPVTKADLLAVAAATQATVQRALASQQMPALPSPEDFAQEVEESVSRSVAQHMAKTSETVAQQIAERIPNLDDLGKLSESIGDSSARDYQRGFVAGKESEDRRAIAVALGMNSFMRTICGGPFIRAFLPNGQAELLAADLPKTNESPDESAPAPVAASQPVQVEATAPAEPIIKDPDEPTYVPKHVAPAEKAGDVSAPDTEITGVLPPIGK